MKGKGEITCNVRSTRYHRIDQLFFVFHVRPKIFLQRFRKEEEETRNVFLFIPLIFVWVIFLRTLYFMIETNKFPLSLQETSFFCKILFFQSVLLITEVFHKKENLHVFYLSTLIKMIFWYNLVLLPTFVKRILQRKGFWDYFLTKDHTTIQSSDCDVLLSLLLLFKTSKIHSEFLTYILQNLIWLL